MTYCPLNTTFTEIWVEHGVSKCFMDTISTVVISLYLLIFGTIQLWMYRKYGTETGAASLSKNKLYVMQKVLLYFVPILSVTRIILQATVLDDKKVYGYMVTILLYSYIYIYIYIIILLKITLILLDSHNSINCNCLSIFCVHIESRETQTVTKCAITWSWTCFVRFLDFSICC